MSLLEKITIHGARVHNLKNIDIEIPRNKFVVITGISGSGKSSLAFDTIYAEGQRRYVETLSAYARQFIGGIERPDVDRIEGLSPSVSIEQKTISHNPRSTVGTVTEIYDFLRLLFAKCGTQHCTNCKKILQRQTLSQIIDSVKENFDNKRINILAPVVKARKGHYRELFEEIESNGFNKVRVDGTLREIVPGMKLDRYKIHSIEIVIDRIMVTKASSVRLSESLETAMRFGGGIVIINPSDSDTKNDILFSEKLACPDCQIGFDEPAPNSFSFNSPYGWCPECLGLGARKKLNDNLIIPDWEMSVADGGIAPLGKPRSNWTFNVLKQLFESWGLDFNTPLKKLNPSQKKTIFEGESEKRKYTYTDSKGITRNYNYKFPGIKKIILDYYNNETSQYISAWAESYMTSELCPLCKGSKLKQSSLHVYINTTTGSKNIFDITTLNINEARSILDKFIFSDKQKIIAEQILKEIKMRLDFLINVGLDYLTLERNARTLSGGEAQRIKLATQIGSQLRGVLYILDEPSIGLHQRDNGMLIDSLKKLRDIGNTVLVVEHDRQMMEECDYIIDLGPGAGEHGGRIVESGRPDELNGFSLTSLYLKGKKKIDIPVKRRKGNGKKIILYGAKGNNLKNIKVEIPLGKFICVTGVSGSGKSSLINETFYRILSRKFYKTPEPPLPYDKIEGLKYINKVIEVDQSPIGRTPRSNPATYTGLFTFIRDLFASLPEAKIRAYKVGRFSFNVKGGRCEDCEGAGLKRIEMNFLPDVYVTCDSCRGKRYNRETLEVRFKGKNISDVLEMTVEEALHFFDAQPSIKRKLSTLYDVGLGYIRLGQSSVTLSGGEAQRVKLSTELSKIQTGKTLYILDEPTTGLHFEDIKMLLRVLSKLVDKGNTVIVIEHNLDVIKTADWIIDMGPEGGNEGGQIIAEGTPEELVKNHINTSYTAKFLKQELER